MRGGTRGELNRLIVCALFSFGIVSRSLLFFSTADFNLKFMFFIREEEDDEDEDEDEGDSKESGEEDSEEESSEEEAGTSVATEQPPGRRRDMKTKQAEAKQTPEAGDIDEDLINPNHVQHKMTISDLNTPRELTRRERYASIF